MTRSARQGPEMEAAQHGPISARSTTGEIRRTQILDAVVEVVAERGVAGASVGLVTARAKVSRRAFYERFDGLEECLIAVLDGALERATPLVVEAFAREGPWQEGMRHALAAMLAFFDSVPALARVCLVELGAASSVVRAHREQILQAFAGLVLARIEHEVSHPSPLAAEGTYASVVGIVNARLSDTEQRPLLELLGPLMGVIVAPFIDQVGVALEVERGNELARELLARPLSSAVSHEDADVGVDVPAVLLSGRAHRARRCLLYVAQQGGRGLSPSNREVGMGIGVPHRGQVTKLLDRLAALGLIEKRPGRPGHPNAWSATPAGKKVASLLDEGDGRSDRSDYQQPE